MVISDALQTEIDTVRQQLEDTADALQEDIIEMETTLTADINTLKDKVVSLDTVTTLMILNQPTLFADHTRVTTNGFYTADNNLKLSYDVALKNGTEVWHDTLNGYRLSTNMEIEWGTKKLTPAFSTELMGESVGLQGQSDIALQLVMNFCISRMIDLDLTNCQLTVAKTILLNKTQYPRKLFIIHGGTITSQMNGYLFSNDSTDSTWGGIKLYDVIFHGVNGCGLKIFDSKIIRVYMDNCSFYDVDSLVVSANPIYFIQSHYYTNLYYVGGKGLVFDSNNAYDILVDSSLFEHRDSFMRIDTPHSVRVTNSVIEGFDGYIYKGRYGRSLVFDDNYFEHNARLTNEPSFQFTNYPSSNAPFAFSYRNNMYIATEPQAESDQYYMIEFEGAPNTFSVAGSWADCNMFKVTRLTTLRNKKIRAFLEAHALNSKKVVNEWGNVDVLEGSQSLIHLQQNSDLSTWTTVSGSVSSLNNGIGFNAPTSGGTTELRMNTGVPIIEYDYYVLGYSISNHQAIQTGHFRLRVVDDANSVLLDYRVPFELLGSNQWELSTPPFRAGAKQRMRVIVSMEGLSGGDWVLLKSLVFQKGTIANPYLHY